MSPLNTSASSRIEILSALQVALYMASKKPQKTPQVAKWHQGSHQHHFTEAKRS